MRKECTLLGVLVVALAGCAGTGGPRIEPVNNGLNRLAAEETPHEQIAVDLPDHGVVTESTDPWVQAAINLQELLDQEQSQEGQAEPSQPEAIAPANASLMELTSNLIEPRGEDFSKQVSSEADSPIHDNAPTEVADAGSDPSPPTPDTNDALADPPEILATNAPTADDIARQLQRKILERAASGDPAETTRAAVLAAALDLPDGDLDALQLHPTERARLDAARAFVRSLIQADASNEEILEQLEIFSTQLTSSTNAFRVREAKLCSEVRAFGDYTPLSNTTFLVGTPNRLIVYTEPDRFECREITVDGRPSFEVEISQELTLYHDAPGELQVWHQPRARIIESSRRQRRDFYLVNEIELPARLTVGSYLLKISTRDEVSGAIAERSIPVRLVADPTLAHAGG